MSREEKRKQEGREEALNEERREEKRKQEGREEALNE